MMDDARKSQVEKWIFAGLLVVLGVSLKSFWHTPAPPPVVQTPTRLSQTTTSAVLQELSPPAQAAQASRAGDRPPIEYTAGSSRDPLVSLLPKPKVEPPAATDGAAKTRAVETPVAPAVSVEGMFWGGPHPQVLIDGELYNIGDTVGGSQIVAITREGVTVVKQNATFVLQPPSVMMEHGR